MFKHQFCRLLSIPITLLSIFGCGDGEQSMEETTRVVKPSEAQPNYYPNTIGSRWVYRNPDGFEWAREVTETTEIGLQLYHVFNYNPPNEDTIFDFLKTPSYRITRNRVLFFVGNELDQAYKQDVTDFFQEVYQDAGNIRVNVNAVSQAELIFFRIPPARGIMWEVINLKVSGNVVFLDFGNFKRPFGLNLVYSGIVTDMEFVETPAGVFENCFRIQYDSKVTVTADNEETETLREEVETIWLAPEVGMVKIEDADGITELIEYDVKLTK